MPDAAHIEPRFAERAAELLDRGDVPAALSLLLAGTKLFPAYATAHLLLGLCYERLGKRQEAELLFAQVRQLVPGLPGRDGVKVYGEDDESGVGFMLRQLEHVKVRRDPVDAVSADTEQQQDPVAPGTADAAVPIVSATLAEIYAQQGRYREAVDAYSRLVQQRPAEAGRYRERLEELERLLEGVDKPGEA